MVRGKLDINVGDKPNSLFEDDNRHIESQLEQVNREMILLRNQMKDLENKRHRLYYEKDKISKDLQFDKCSYCNERTHIDKLIKTDKGLVCKRDYNMLEA